VNTVDWKIHDGNECSSNDAMSFWKKEIAAKAAILRADQKAVVFHQRWPGEYRRLENP
jgi:hypothetical protein